MARPVLKFKDALGNWVTLSAGPRGDKGDKGDTGDVGPVGGTRHVVRGLQTAQVSLSTNTTLFTICSVTATVPSGVWAMVTGMLRSVNLSTSSGTYATGLYDGSTLLTRNLEVLQNSTDVGGKTVQWYVQGDGTAHTYNLTLQKTSGAASAIVPYTASEPCWIVVDY